MSHQNPALAEQQLLAEQFTEQKRERKREMEAKRIDDAEDLARRSATLRNIRRLRPQPENRERLNASARRAAKKLGLAALSWLSRGAHDVYTLIRTAVARGYAGLKASAQEMGKHLGMSKSTFWRAMKILRSLKLIGSTPNYEASGAYTCIKTRRVFHQQQRENTYWIGYGAPERDVKMCLEAEGRTRSKVSPSDRKEARKPQDLTPPPSLKKEQPLPDYVRKEGSFLSEGENLERVRPSAVFAELAFDPDRLDDDGSAFYGAAGLGGRADRATVAPLAALGTSNGSAIEADEGGGASSGPSFDAERALWLAENIGAMA